MPTAHAHVPTDRAGRYLVQLCRHLGQMSRMRHRPATGHRGQPPPTVRHVDWSDTAGTIHFAQGTCTLRATSDALVLRIDAEDEQTLRQLQDGIARRLGTIGRRDDLTVHWQQSNPETDLPAEKITPTIAVIDASPTRRPRRIGAILLGVAVVVAAILVHIGLLGAVLATSTWTGWGITILVAIILVKIIAVGSHSVLGRTAFRHRSPIHRGTRGHAVVSADAPHEMAAPPDDTA